MLIERERALIGAFELLFGELMLCTRMKSSCRLDAAWCTWLIGRTRLRWSCNGTFRVAHLGRNKTVVSWSPSPTHFKCGEGDLMSRLFSKKLNGGSHSTPVVIKERMRRQWVDRW